MPSSSISTASFQAFLSLATLSSGTGKIVIREWRGDAYCGSELAEDAQLSGYYRAE